MKVLVRPNKYEPGRANLCVYNWASQKAVDADLSAVGLKTGDRYAVRDVQNFFLVRPSRPAFTRAVRSRYP